MAERTILWDSTRNRAIRSIWNPVPVALRDVFAGVRMGDILIVKVVAGQLAGGVFRSSPILDGQVSLSLARENGELPSPDHDFQFTDGTNNSNLVPLKELTAGRLERELNSLGLVASAGLVGVSAVGRNHYFITSRKPGAVGYALSSVDVSGVSRVSTVRAGAVGVAQVDSFWYRPAYVEAASVVDGSLAQPAVSIGVIEAGDAGKRAVQDIEVVGDYEGGTFLLSDGTNFTAPIPFNAATNPVADALNDMLGAGTVTVNGISRNYWRVVWNAEGAQSALSADPSGLTAMQGVSGTFDLSNAAHQGQGGARGYEFILSATVGSSLTETLFTAPVTIGAAH